MTKPAKLSSLSSLSQHVAALRKKEAASPEVADNSIVCWVTGADKPYLHMLKRCVGSASAQVTDTPVTTLTSVKMYCKQKRIYRIATTSSALLSKLLAWDKRAAPSVSNYAGSYFTLSPMTEDEPAIEIVFIQPLKQLATVPYGVFMTRRLITKLTTPDSWYQATDFSWSLLTAATEASDFELMQRSFVVSIDIETLRENAVIRCLSYTGIRCEDGKLVSATVVLPLDSEYALAIMRKWNWQLKAPKILQNGKYDAAYLARYGAPMYNYLYDTANMFHCWHSELPKDLGFLNAFFIRKAMYWKDLAQTNDLHEYYKYNALDTWGTANAFLAMILEAPEYAITNYLLEFPLTFPAHMCEMRGIERDTEVMRVAKAEQDAIIAEAQAKLDTILDIPEGQNFNVNSAPQMKSMLRVLGCSDLPSADSKNLNKARFRHPFNARVVRLVLTIRKARKLVSTYLTAGKEFNRPDGTGNRILFALNPHGTDTGRLASREHHFWCGLQVQNIPRGPAVKQTLKADPGFLLCEVDLAQAESRDTAYISGDETLIHNVEYSPDFHCANAALFFGKKFEELYDVDFVNKDGSKGKVINKPLRQLGKPVNHGANYNMGAYVLIDTMGEENVLLAKQLLGLPRFWSTMQVAEHLLAQFHKGYPKIRSSFYAGMAEEVALTGKLSSKAVHHNWSDSPDMLQLKGGWEAEYDRVLAQRGAWTRTCFKDPSKSKPAMNAYIAHPPQSLNAQSLNKSFLAVFTDIAINPKYRDNFKLIAQIHDSILFQFRIGHEYLADMVKERMEVPATIRAYDGKIRTFVVPADPSNSAVYWSELKD